MPIKEKLKKYCDYKGLSMRQFSQKIGVSDAFLRTKGSINSNLLPIIRKILPDLSMEWLLFDIGEMILLNNKQKVDYKKYIEVLEENRKLNKLLNYHDKTPQ